MVVFGDLHLSEKTADICFRVLEEIERMSLADDKRVVCLGDLWHIRYRVDVRLLNRLADLMSGWQDKGIELDLVPGNHDQIDVEGHNALEILEAVHDNCLVWTEPGIDQRGHFGFVPYRKDPEAQQEALYAVESLGPPIIFGHFGVKGAVMNNGRADSEGLGVDLRSNGAPLILGHYHKRQQGPGWEYVGSPYQTSFGEVGNVCGVLQLDQATFERVWLPLDVGAPKHYILKWDPATEDSPQVGDHMKGDHVRIDIEASHEMIVSGKFKGVLETVGLADVEINVVPTKVERQHKFALQGGETLLDAAGRFAAERLPGTPKDVMQERAMAALRRWADG